MAIVVFTGYNGGMSEFGTRPDIEPKQSAELSPTETDRSRLEETFSKYEISLPNLDELVSGGLANLEVIANGKPVKFDQFAVVLDETAAGEPATAEVVFIEKSQKEENPGIGIPLYVKLGQELLKHGITLTSSSVQYGPGRDLWQKLATLGYAEKAGQLFRFKDRE